MEIDLAKLPHYCRTSPTIGYACSPAVVEAAYRAARRRRPHSAGVDGMDRAAFDRAWPGLSVEIPDLLRSGGYEWSPFAHFVMRSVGARDRDVCEPTRRDGVASGMLMRAAYDLFVDRALHDSASAYRLKRGPRQMLDYMYSRATEARPWFLGLDVHWYYPSIDLDTACDMMLALTQDPAVVMYTRTRFRSPALSGGVEVPVPGVGPGDPLAGLLANLYLADEDRILAARLPVYARYCDDLAALAETRAQADDGIALMTDLLARRGLKPKEGSIRTVDLRVDAAELLGLRFDRLDVSIPASRVERLRAKIDDVGGRYSLRPDLAAERAIALVRGTLAYARGARNLGEVYEIARAASQRLPGPGWPAILRRCR